MERVEFFGAAVFVPIFVVSIGLLLDPSVMFTGETLGLAAVICGVAVSGKAIACWLAGTLLGFSRPERVGMFVLTVPQAAATLAVTLIGFEIGLFSTSVVNAVLVLIVVSIVLSAVLAEKVIEWIPTKREEIPPLGGSVLVLTTSGGPSDAAVRAATLLSRPDGGHSNVLITRTEDEPRLDRAAVRAIEERICRHGFDGIVRTEIGGLSDTLAKELRAGGPSLVVVDD